MTADLDLGALRELVDAAKAGALDGFIYWRNDEKRRLSERVFAFASVLDRITELEGAERRLRGELLSIKLTAGHGTKCLHSITQTGCDSCRLGTIWRAAAAAAVAPPTEQNGESE